jgi:hypothetical protein
MDTPPPASFEMLVASLVMQAQVGLGMLAMPGQEPEVNLAWAKHAIDLLGILEEKTKNNLSLEESRLLGNSLTELRFRYLSASKSSVDGGSKTVEGASSPS